MRREKTKVAVIALTLLAFGFLAKSSAQVQIGTSSNPLATAFNNGRRMVRTSEGFRGVVYQDSAGGFPIICFTGCWRGANWSYPDTISNGSFPSIVVDHGDNIHLVFMSADSLPDILYTWSANRGSTWVFPAVNISQSSGTASEYPAIEICGQNLIHVVWQESWEDSLSDIFYSTSPVPGVEGSFSPPIDISLSPSKSSYPSIASNLTFSSDTVHIVWAEYWDGFGYPVPFIAYRSTPDAGLSWNPPLGEPPLDATGGTTGLSPCISVFTFYNWYIEESQELAYVIWDDGEFGNVYGSIKFVSEDTFFTPDTICLTTPYPRPSVDDPVPMLPTISATWENDYEVYHGDIVYWTFEYWELYLNLVSEDDTLNSRYPNICYRRYNPDSCDVVWTEGNHPPYPVMYKREKKTDVYVPPEQSLATRPRGYLLSQNYPNPFNPVTEISFFLPSDALVKVDIYNVAGQKVRTLVNGKQTSGYHKLHWDGKTDSGRNMPTGVYLLRFEAGSSSDSKKMVLIR